MDMASWEKEHDLHCLNVDFLLVYLLCHLLGQVFPILLYVNPINWIKSTHNTTILNLLLVNFQNKRRITKNSKTMWAKFGPMVALI